MSKIALFAGTTEGRELCEFLIAQHMEAIIYTATEYGKVSLPTGETIRHVASRLTREEMIEQFQKEEITLVLDATHPYAVEVTKNCEEAANQCQLPFARILRDSVQLPNEEDFIQVVSSCAEAATLLNQRKERALITTGSKELATFTVVYDYKNTLIARVLPTKETLLHCISLGFEGKNLIAMQGPFSEELNYQMLKETNCTILVTKEAGQAGGFEEKVRAAKRAKATVIVVKRPIKEEGYTVEEIKKRLTEKYINKKYINEKYINEKYIDEKYINEKSV